MDDENLLKTKDLVRILNLSERTIYKYIKEGKIIPFNKETWTYDGEYLFRKDDIDVNSLIEKKPGLSSGEVLDELGISHPTLMKYIKEGFITSEQHIYKGRNMNFFSKEEVEKFKSTHSKKQNHTKKDYYHKSKSEKFILFQLYINEETGSQARIIHIDKDFNKIKVLTDEDQVFDLPQLIENGYKPSYILREGKYITRRGYVKFKFIKPTQLDSRIFKTLDYFYKVAGPLNVRLYDLNEYIKVEVKPTILKLDETDRDEIIEYETLLKNSLIEGKVLNSPKGLLLESDLEIIQLGVPSELKKIIVKAAGEKGLAVEEYLLNIIKAHIKG